MILLPEDFFTTITVDFFIHSNYLTSHRRRVEQLAARRAHNPEVTGSSPVPAKV